ncbi:E3 ubiquitin-protein ligase RHA2B-like [Solanum dulcamara]|uniref:E3 ubiquitin-protein ligase RHA2B-like n=1 Tax=Solanum dulcamara TaxID=45834 RepID=UPI002485B4E9|nr:E3 ubiquitin-protein ligase RHA2B-like [Solanum dulcamara]
MGFLFHVIELPKLTFLWRHLKLMVIVSLTRLGLYKPPPEEDDADSSYNPNSYILLLDGTCPSLVTVPIEVATAAVKLKVPILLYSDYLLLRRRNCGQFVKECSICLESMEQDEEVRELITCSHVFHRGCLDTWVNDGHVTCPLCRCMLLPPKLTSFRSNCRKPFISSST